MKKSIISFCTAIMIMLFSYSLFAQAKVKTEKLDDNNNTQKITVLCNSFDNTRGVIVCIYKATEKDLNENTAIEKKMLSAYTATRNANGKLDTRMKFGPLKKGEYKVAALSRNNLAPIAEPWFFSVRDVNDITGAIPKFAITKIEFDSYPDGDIVSGQPAKDITIWWQGNVQFPLKVTLYPVSPTNNYPGWKEMTTEIHSNENPIIAKGFLWAENIKIITTVNYALKLEEIKGQEKTQAYPYSFKILPAK